MIVTPVPFSFDAADHVYRIGDVRVPSITQLLKLSGHVDDRYYTEESRQRGTAVHELTKDFDLGALTLPSLDSLHRGYVLGYIAACEALKPEWDQIEEPDVHPTFRFGGRPDRLGTVMGRLTIGEIKTGGKPQLAEIVYTDEDGVEVRRRPFSNAHEVQTAAQAILVSWRWGLAPERWQRLCIYLRATGKFSVERHDNPRDFDEAYRILKEYASC